MDIKFFIETEIRKFLVKAIIGYAKENSASELDTKIRFFSHEIEGSIICCYGLMVNGKHVKLLKFSDFVGVLMAVGTQGLIEPYIVNLYQSISEKENIPVDGIQIIISATKHNPTFEDLKAVLYGNGKIIRELNVSEFVTNESGVEANNCN